MTWPAGSDRNQAPREYTAPPELFDPLNQEFGFTLDAAASPENALCGRFLTKDDDALAQDWGRGAVWCHPPNTNLYRWVKKGHEAAKNGATVVMLLPARTGSKWWHEFIISPWVQVERRSEVGSTVSYLIDGVLSEVRYQRGRVRFLKGNGTRAQAPFDSVIVVFRSQDILPEIYNAGG